MHVARSYDFDDETFSIVVCAAVLVNVISNAIKCSDPRKPKRVVEIDTAPGERAGVCTYEFVTTPLASPNPS